MIPYALGQSVTFTSKRGPKLSKFDIKTFLKKSEKDISQNLSPIYKAIEITRKKLNKKKIINIFCWCSMDATNLYAQIKKKQKRNRY